MHLWMSLKCKILENIMKNGAFSPEEQMLHFPQYFQNYRNEKIFEIYIEIQKYLKI